MTDDGQETDLDLGHYRRFIDESLKCGQQRDHGKIYSSVICKDARETISEERCR
ncbi:hypothetical protein MASR1M66_02050 [Aminivibrio sp.]